jgi:hypothetical protein
MKVFQFFISKMKIFKSLIQIFVAYLVWPIFFKFHFKFQNHFFSIFSISLSWYLFQISKAIFFSKFFISNFPYDINEFFLSPRLPNLLKDCKKNTYLTLQKTVIYCIPPPSGMVHRKKTLIFSSIIKLTGSFFLKKIASLLYPYAVLLLSSVRLQV